MKRNFFKVGLFALAAVLGLNSCTKGGNSISGANYMATVIENNGASVLYQLDGDMTTYYTSTSVNSSAVSLSYGDRVYLLTLTIDYDNQPAGATGSKTNPLQMTNVQHLKLEKDFVKHGDGSLLVSDKLEAFYTPYAVETKAGTFMNLGGYTKKDAKPSHYLFFDRQSNDTLYYSYKVKLGAEGVDKTYEQFIKTYEMVGLPSECKINITFNSKERPTNSTGIVYPTDSTCVFSFKRSSSNQ